jgi:hypothetical protein
MQSFTFIPNRYEIWSDGKMIALEKINSPIVAKIINIDGKEKIEINFLDRILNDKLAQSNIYDIFRTSGDRLQLITIPSETNSKCVGIIAMQTILGATRQRKDFLTNESYCCNLFTVNGIIEKITFSFSNPEKLIEFYSESKFRLQFLFKSSDHLR